MKKILLLLITVSILLVGNIKQSNAQADTIMNFCSQFIKYPYISDGQEYLALITEGETAEFRATFYGGATYRIVACSGLTKNNLIFRLYDKDRNELFSSSDHQNTQFWNFQFNSTIDCIIEAELDPNSASSGFALLLIGFKK